MRKKEIETMIKELTGDYKLAGFSWKILRRFIICFSILVK